MSRYIQSANAATDEARGLISRGQCRRALTKLLDGAEFIGRAVGIGASTSGAGLKHADAVRAYASKCARQAMARSPRKRKAR
jgi:hypothetical protein